MNYNELPYDYNWLRTTGRLKSNNSLFSSHYLKYKLLHKDRGELMTTIRNYMLLCSTFKMRRRYESKRAKAHTCLLSTEPSQLPNYQVIFLYGLVPLLFLSLCIVEVHKDTDLEKLWPFGCRTFQFQIFLIYENPLKFTKLQFYLYSAFHNSHSPSGQ